MDDLVKRLKEEIIVDAFEAKHIMSSALATRLIRERADAADEITRLTAALQQAEAERDRQYDENVDRIVKEAAWEARAVAAEAERDKAVEALKAERDISEGVKRVALAMASDRDKAEARLTTRVAELEAGNG